MGKDVNVHGYISKSKVQSESFHGGVGSLSIFFHQVVWLGAV